MSTLTVTFLSLALLAAWLGCYDLWQLYHHGVQATISAQVYVLSQSHPIVPLTTGLVLGVLLGHLFWAQR